MAQDFAQHKVLRKPFWFSILFNLFILSCLTHFALPTAQARDDIVFGSGLFWKIEKEGRKPSYLLGTMHVADPRVLKIKQRVEPYLKRRQS